MVIITICNGNQISIDLGEEGEFKEKINIGKVLSNENLKIILVFQNGKIQIIVRKRRIAYFTFELDETIRYKYGYSLTVSNTNTRNYLPKCCCPLACCK